jgi:drug/metabolite transporter (DMT)-like permease
MDQPLPRSQGGAIDGISLVFLSLTVLIWASSFTGIRIGLTTFGPVELGALRFLIAAVPAAIYLAIRRPPLPRPGEAWRFVAGGVVYIGLYTALLNTGEQTVPAGAASFIINVSPIITALFAVATLGERFPPRAWLGTALSFTGIGLIAYGQGGGLTFSRDALLILGAAGCTAAGTLVQKPLFARHDPLMVSGWNMVIGALALSPALPSAFAVLPRASGEAIGALFFLGLVASLVGYATWTVALSRLPASRASNFLYCIAPVATLVGYLWLGEVPTTLTVAGGVMSLGGVVLVNWRHRPNRAAELTETGG